MKKNIWKKRALKTTGWFRLMSSYLLLRYTRWNADHLKKEIVNKGIDRLHVGCGLVVLDGWLNIYFERREEYGCIKERNGKLFLNYNLLKKWPVNDNSISYIAGSHFIEHLDLNKGITFLQECFRVLKSGGIIRLSCPDLEIYARNYVNGNTAFFQNELIREWCAFSQAETPGEILAAKAYDSGGSHKWFYDFESLKHILEKAGFQNVKRCQRQEGQMPDIEDIELSQRELETVYIEAVKH